MRLQMGIVYPLCGSCYSFGSFGFFARNINKGGIASPCEGDFLCGMHFNPIRFYPIPIFEPFSRIAAQLEKKTPRERLAIVTTELTNCEVDILTFTIRSMF